jgi:hypothetical protein
MGTGYFWRVECDQGVTLAPTPLLVLRYKNRVELYLYKGKAIPVQALTVPEVSRRLRFQDFKTIDT